MNTLRVNVPYSFGGDTNTDEVYFSDLELSDGAVAYYATSNSREAIQLTGRKNTPAATEISLTAEIDEDGVLDTSNAAMVYVLSEKVDTDEKYGNNGWAAGQGTLASLATQGKATLYYVYGEKAAPQKGAELISIDSTLDENVTVEMKANNTIEITVPWSYVDTNSAKPNDGEPAFTLNFRTSAMAVAKIGTKDYKLVSDLGVAENAEKASQFNVDHGKLYADGTEGGEVSSIKVYSEDYLAGNKQGTVTTYTVKVNVNDAEKGAELTSVKAAGVTGTFSGKTINLVLPYGTDKYPVVLDLEASKMASITVDGEPYNATTGYDLNSDVKILVISENGANKTEYTLKTTVAESFFDVTTDDWFYEEVMQAAENGWVNGQSAGYFGPDGTLKRGDFALMIARILGYDEASYSKTAFPDVASDKYYSAAVAFCKENNIIDGDDKGNFNGEDAITREQMAKILCQALQLKVTIPEKTYDDDAKIADWAKDYVYACQEAGVMEGDNGSFRPKDNATRAEAATVLVRAFA